MPKRGLLWHVIPSYGLLVVAAALAFGWLGTQVLERSLLDATRAELDSTARFLAGELGTEIPAGLQEFARLARRIDEASGIRVALLLPDGQVATDSGARPQELQAEHPEILAALKGAPEDDIRYSAGLDERVMYFAAPVKHNGKPLGAIYLSKRLGPVDRAVARWQAWTLAIAGLLALLAIPLARRAIRSLRENLTRQTAALGRLAEGQWATRLPIPDTREMAAAASAFNQLAAALEQRIVTLTQNNNEQQAVLASMAEGVLAVDTHERIISLNDALARLLKLDQSQVQGRPLQEVVRNADLSRFVGRALDDHRPISADILLHGDRERVMQAHGSALHDVEGKPIGVVIVLNDITDFRKLEMIRRDFVANVSHELKTPVTSIKGFVETLLDGALQDPVDAERFLRIVAKQADRLHAIIEDLLALSKIEQTEESEDLSLELTPLAGVLEGAIAACQTAALDRKIDVRLECEPGLAAKINPLLLEQAVVNLLDNAIKYSEPAHQVDVRGATQGSEVTIAIADHGCGIAEEHAKRIFERFYRVDRARSRMLGGTGLGLAIVKHIVQAHRGHVTVDSTLGVGSTFTIRLPQ